MPFRKVHFIIYPDFKWIKTVTFVIETVHKALGVKGWGDGAAGLLFHRLVVMLDWVLEETQNGKIKLGESCKKLLKT